MSDEERKPMTRQAFVTALSDFQNEVGKAPARATLSMEAARELADDLKGLPAAEVHAGQLVLPRMYGMEVLGDPKQEADVVFDLG